MIHRGRVKN